jgi:hypothetical protein
MYVDILLGLAVEIARNNDEFKSKVRQGLNSLKVV